MKGSDEAIGLLPSDTQTVPNPRACAKPKAAARSGLNSGGVYMDLLLLDVGAAGSDCAAWKKCRGSDPAAGATILNADDRPYRESAAAASGQDGRGVDHGRRYKATPGFRQDAPRSNCAHTARHSHSMICAITSPNNNSAAAQTSAETKLAIWNCH